MEVVGYGAARQQRFELTRTAAGAPTVVLVHGGFWQAGYGLDLMQPLVPSLVAAGWTVANIDYRGVGDDGGGWSGTFEDAAAATDALAAIDGIDVRRIVTVGHSAGGHLAVWLAGRHRLPDGAPGASPQVRPIGALSQAGVVDLVAAAEARLGDGATQSLLGGEPSEVPDRYAIGSPAALVPIGVPVELVHGVDDRIVPPDQSRRYDDVTRAVGDPVVRTEVPGDHFTMIDPATDAWAACVAGIRRLLAPHLVL
ncbi:MAG: alpha/beta fold hydrolase [Acidimicrobiales bacterium]|nr:alpha/beta fold hydrolase [Acidimicrobiales bacterium]